MKLKPILLLLAIFLPAMFSCKKKDKEGPVVTLKGDAVITVILNTSYTDPGADAFDNNDGTVAIDITGEVNTDFAGVYSIVYSAYDKAGNQGEAVRTVIVKNESENFTGNYAAKCYTPNDTVGYFAPLVVSTMVNKRVWLGGFAAFSNASVFADISNDTIRFPNQLAEAGNPPAIHKFAGSGLISFSNDSTIFKINFTDSVSGNISNGYLVYKK